ncbi:unnamed protein product [marine sediment metagenome]|uniref:Uncharacterized protein n=1 Tax=marine sediment metagenome TaxID=412755 RepID=X1MCN3_9ZZZZ
MDPNIGEELRDVVGELPIGDKKARPPFGDFDFDVGEGELGDSFGAADNLSNPLSIEVIVNIPISVSFEDSSHLTQI